MAFTHNITPEWALHFIPYNQVLIHITIILKYYNDLSTGTECGKRCKSTDDQFEYTTPRGVV